MTFALALPLVGDLWLTLGGSVWLHNPAAIEGSVEKSMGINS